MKREEDVFELYNKMNEMLDSINIGNEEKESNKKIDVPEMPKAFIDDNKRPVIYDKQEKIDDKKEEIKLEEKKEIDVVIEELIKEEVKDNKTQQSEKKEKQKQSRKTIKKKKNNKNKSKVWVAVFAILDSFAIICIFLMYGPISYFRNLWVTSAMTTMTHQYFAYIFFNDEQVKEIMANNVVIEVEGDTNQEEIQFEEPKEEQVVYSSPEEEQILTKDEGNDLYKVIDIEGNGYKGHLLVVYDPSKIKLGKVTNMKYGWTLDQFMNKTGAVAGINASGFSYNNYRGYTFTGTVIIDGQIIANNGATGFGGGIIGFTNDNVLVLTKTSANEAVNMGIRDAVSFGPFLIVNGVASQFKGNGGYGIAPRTAIGQRKDGIVLMLVIDGRRPGHSIGVDMVELTNIMLKYGAYNASNLDGGGSSTFYANGKILSVAGGSGYSGDRYLPNAWLVYE